MVAACGDNLGAQDGAIGDTPLTGSDAGLDTEFDAPNPDSPPDAMPDGASAVCGDGIVDPTETCDTAITSGAGKCPTSCDDDQACTTDTLNMGGTCEASCTNVAITQPIDGDGCCPSGANPGNDDDCLAACGDGIVSVGETCDTGIASGIGSCPTSCNDGVACTTDALHNAGSCTAVCSHDPILTAIDGDGCCPLGATGLTDSDCAVCGNGIVEHGESCDDGNTMAGDGCSATCQIEAVADAYRFTSLALKDPHIWVNFLGCTDFTDTGIAGYSVNTELSNAITMDADGDGDYDLSPTLVFRPLNQGNTLTSPLDVDFADCTTNTPPVCMADAANPSISTTGTSHSTGTCLAPLAGTTDPAHATAVTSTSGPCFVSGTNTITLTLSGVNITLHDAQVAATYTGSPATGMTHGLLMGFLTKTDADAATLPASLPLIGGMPFSSVLAGGTGACPTWSDLDTDNGVQGWWFYLNFETTKATWSGM
ncbi:MAG TPA: DUF4215 domain-containing protein [Kofleriaceae bacterium]